MTRACANDAPSTSCMTATTETVVGTGNASALRGAVGLETVLSLVCFGPLCVEAGAADAIVGQLISGFSLVDLFSYSEVHQTSAGLHRAVKRRRPPAGSSMPTCTCFMLRCITYHRNQQSRQLSVAICFI